MQNFFYNHTRQYFWQYGWLFCLGHIWLMPIAISQNLAKPALKAKIQRFQGIANYGQNLHPFDVKISSQLILQQAKDAIDKLDFYHSQMRTNVFHNASNDVKQIKADRLKEEYDLKEEAKQLKDIPRLSTLVQHQNEIAKEMHKKTLDDADEAMNRAKEYAKCYEMEKKQKEQAIEVSAKSLSKQLKMPMSKYGHIKLSPKGTGLYVRNYELKPKF